MADETLGTARIDVTVNTETMQAGITAAQNKMAQFGTQAAAEYEKASASSKRYADSLLNQINNLGKSRAEQIAYNAQMKLGGDLGAQLAAKALAQGEAMKSAAAGTSQLGFAFSGLRSQVTQLLTAYLGFEAVKGYFTSAIDTATQLNKMSQTTGIAVSTLSALRLTADSTSVSMDDLSTGLDHLAKNAAAAAAGNKQQAATFAAFGISVKDANGNLKPTAQLLDQIAGKFSSYADSAQKSADAQAIFGRSGAQLIPFLNELGGDGGLAGVTARAKELGLTLSDNTVKEVDKLGNQTAILKDVMASWAVNMTGSLVPALTGVIGGLTAYAAKAKDASDASGGLGGFIVDATGVFITFEGEVQKAAVYVGEFFDEMGHIRDAFMSGDHGPSALLHPFDNAKAQVEAWRAANKLIIADAAARDAQMTAIDQKTGDKIAAMLKGVATAEANVGKGGTGTAPKMPDFSAQQAALEALKSFQDYVNGLNPSSLTVQGDAALTKYVQDMAELEQRFQDTVSKGVDAGTATALFWKRAAENLAKYQNDLNKVTAYEEDFTNQLANEAQARQKQIDLQVASVGMGQQEFQRMQALNQVYDDFEKRLADINKEKRDGLINDEEAKVLTAQLSQQEQVAVQQMINGYKAADQARAQWQNGLVAGIQDWIAQGQDVAGMVSGAFTDAFGNMNDAIVNFVQTGKFSFKSFADSLISDLTRIALRIQENQILTSLLGAFATGPSGYNVGYFGSFNTGAATTTANSVIDNIMGHANGGVFGRSGEITAFAQGGVVSKPTLFPFARGIGLMGEAGDEAIMPLSKMSDGKLGVKAQTSGAGNTTVIVENHTDNKAQVQQSKDGSGNDIIRVIVGQAVNEVNRQIARNGSVFKTLQQTFGLQRRGVPVSG